MAAADSAGGWEAAEAALRLNEPPEGQIHSADHYVKQARRRSLKWPPIFGQCCKVDSGVTRRSFDHVEATQLFC